MHVAFIPVAGEVVDPALGRSLECAIGEPILQSMCHHLDYPARIHADPALAIYPFRLPKHKSHRIATAPATAIMPIGCSQVLRTMRRSRRPILRVMGLFRA